METDDITNTPENVKIAFYIFWGEKSRHLLARVKGSPNVLFLFFSCDYSTEVAGFRVLRWDWYLWGLDFSMALREKSMGFSYQIHRCRLLRYGASGEGGGMSSKSCQ